MKTRPILSFKNCYNCFLVYVALTKFENKFVFNLYFVFRYYDKNFKEVTSRQPALANPICFYG